MDELSALTRYQRDCHECSIMVLTETWLTVLTPDTDANLDGFQLRQVDRTAESGKSKGGGLTVFAKDRWCISGHITVKEQVCSKDIELLAVSMRLYYLPTEFTQVIVFAVSCPHQLFHPPVYYPILTSTSLSTAFMSQTPPTAPPTFTAPPIRLSAHPAPLCQCRIVESIFNLSLNLGKVPLLWKTTCMVPVTKIPHPQDFNSYRPVSWSSWSSSISALWWVLLWTHSSLRINLATWTTPSSSFRTEHCLTWRNLEAL